MTEPRSEIVEKLLAIAAQCANLEPSEVLNSLQCPDWSADAGSDWELYVYPHIRELWHRIGLAAQLVAFVDATGRIIDGGLNLR